MSDVKPEAPAVAPKVETAETKPQEEGKSVTKPSSEDEIKAAGQAVPVDDDAMSAHDLTIPTVEGKSEDEVKELLEKAAKQGE